ncbi:Cytochrome P450 81Q32 [Camellia lanceoleosa]|uniref:Cytochrome P450 81Q32 n=1 Tax=Camellia lanceoleosa TaxID=1840588 RepID=A0ACC0I4X9_9ERIC|nr:Cytochrome P450 81Q32 [Camellia lanceoleosa]
MTMEWAMSLLMNHPEVLKKARAELTFKWAKNAPSMNRSPSCITFKPSSPRLFDCFAAPLLVPHMASNDCTIEGFDATRYNLVGQCGAIHRDPQVWDDPTSFKSERFEGGEAEGHKLMPFGMGRRSCPGVGLAQRVVGLGLCH